MTITSIDLNQAVSLAVASEGRLAYSAYQLGVLVFRLIRTGEAAGRRLKVREPQRRHYTQAVGFLTDYGVLAPVRGLPKGAAFLATGSPSASAVEIACTVDPFAYVSHLSAMEMHGLTDRISQTLFLSAPAPRHWRQFADERMQRDLGEGLADYLEAGFPKLLRTRFSKILDRPIHLSQSVHLGAFRKTPDSEVRVATLGRTFLDMLRQPELCGGIHHVLAIFQEHAQRYLALIAAEVDQHGSRIDQVRAGYVLEELCGLQHPSFAEWQKSVARGGSRKLVAANEYASTYSERWALSLNAD